MAAHMPAAEFDIDVELVRGLLLRQFPDLAERAIEPLAFGWDNAMFLVGDDLVARLPRRRAAVPLITSEQRWLPTLSDRLPLPIPAPIRLGTADDGFPWPWSICPFIPGASVLDLVDSGGRLTDPAADAVRLGTFLTALHTPASGSAPVNEFRGVPLADRDERFCTQVAALAYTIEPDPLLRAWRAALAVAPWDRPPVWVHGDLHPGNVVADRGRIVAVVDLGDLTGGDPATDVAAGWMFFDPATRVVFRDACGVDDDTWARGRGWALCMGVATVANSADNPPFARHGLRTIDAVLADR